MEKFKNTAQLTEADSLHDNLEKMGTDELLHAMNIEDKKVPEAVEQAIPQIIALVDIIVEKMQEGGRLFYIGAGTSGRLGVVDASECPPTFGIPEGTVIGIIAGGDRAIRQTVAFAEDDRTQGWEDLLEHKIDPKDIVVGIAASGNTPYVVAALEACNKSNIITACIVCNKDSSAAQVSKYPIEVIVGPEFITGSTRMKSGTAQKLVLNMISTAVMIKLGKVMGNKMLDMKLSNNKLIDRGTQMVVEKTGL
ncbi:N-acetylmuramic acid 6-phosphate etherase [Candidatus Kaiserbacteria bacterium RIFCSPHIGHO2_01_FULL_54_36]|uniref:N-acetylmuramic acid 6-phosphate etherase n=1 Tax=Candidatus Kaiserbacteria bacterium RIFCSPHIGHO2_01_FULL_54_36 TaxID=1798482 RepID=A0A1F6CKU3_9BACT|nr:MAG: N-acetylmuramic acid 6-phosphate etherase [Candidatus Kaiserbacteria bacterium RIFCSPHIGHO2_01_FULL_54_36]OGG75478.1 MAG: N-acetylmuramic acid 6-phosphate etherase [Candidatus Kaiserbacteria bacterium RIFCSPLOWO2_01_FULL_54_22]